MIGARPHARCFPNANLLEVVMGSSSVYAAVSTGLKLALLVSSPLLLLSQNKVPSTSNGPALAAYGNCPAPTKEGVNVCTPGPNSYINAPFQIIASGTSGRGQVQAMELWADGKKISQTNGTPFDQPITLPAGTHQLTVIELDSTGAFVKSSPFTLTVEGNDGESCSAPGAPGVNVCEPQVDSCHTSAWLPVIAAGTGKSGTVSRMELWINGTKIANFPGDKINTNLFVQDFSTVTIYEVDSNGASIKSASIVVQSC